MNFQLKLFQTYNWLFFGFLYFIICVRASFFIFSETIDYYINCVEHLYFHENLEMFLLKENDLKDVIIYLFGSMVFIIQSIRLK